MDPVMDEFQSPAVPNTDTLNADLATLREAAERATPVLCTHTEVSDWWGEERGHPTHYRCLTCNDLFPVIGDTDLWKPVEIRKEPT